MAHAAAPLIAQWLAIAKKPVVISHSGVRGTCDNARNLSDAQLRAVARNGGVVGIGYWSKATCGDDVASIVRAIRHAVAVAGIEHVALGSDCDGAVTTPFDASGLPQLTQGLLEAGVSVSDAGAILGGNALRVFEQCLPES